MKKSRGPRPTAAQVNPGPSACCQLPDIQEHLIQPLADLFQHLSDPCRLRLLLALAHGEHPVGGLAKHLGVTSSAVSHQLQILRQARLVAFRREGQMIYYSLSDDHVKQLVIMGREHVMES
jgi:ArsR family transcriptional regulator